MRRRSTKIICTIGPAVWSREKLLELAKAGMDVARINFSHAKQEKVAQIISDLRSIEKEVGRPIGILGDIQGPKIRVGKLEDKKVEIVTGKPVWFEPGEAKGKDNGDEIVLTTTYKEFIKDIPPGIRILLDDGLLELRSIEKTDRGVRCEVINGGMLSENRGINVPDVSFSVSSITEKDYGDILFCLDQKVDFIALSFVRSDQEIRHLKGFVQKRESPVKIYAKIEMREAIAHLEDIIRESDGILIARGDLAVEVGNEQVPVLQKKITRKCNVMGKTVIIATQMLMSMVENPRPSRAEASDVANAIVENADAVMLSNETAVGKYPVEALQMMHKIAVEMESQPREQAILYDEWKLPPQAYTAIALLQGGVRLAAIVKAKLLVCLSQSGNSPLLISKCRPHSLVIAITSQESTYRQLSLNWGVSPLLLDDMDMNNTAVFETIAQRLSALHLCESGDKIVITAGLPRLASGSTNTIKVQIV